MGLCRSDFSKRVISFGLDAVMQEGRQCALPVPLAKYSILRNEVTEDPTHRWVSGPANLLSMEYFAGGTGSAPCLPSCITASKQTENILNQLHRASFLHGPSA